MSREKPTLPHQRTPCALPPKDSTASFWHSSPSPLLLGHRSTRHLPQTADVVIIGSGMTGASVARHLLHRESSKSNEVEESEDLNVVMLEAREACWGATGRNGGHCQPLLFEHPHDPSIGHFELANYGALQTLITSENVHCEWVGQPGIRAIYGRSKLAAAQEALKTVASNAPELREYMMLVTDKETLRGYRIESADGAIVTRTAARMWPYKLVSHVLESLLTSSDLRGMFNLQTLTPCTHLSRSSSDSRKWTVTTDRGEIHAKRVVLATNAYTSHLLPVFADLIVPCRGEMSALLPPASLSNSNRLTTSYGFEGDGLDDYLIQRPNSRGGHLMFGGGRTSAPSLGVTDDSVIDSHTAAYLRKQLATAFRLPERNGQGRGEMEASHQWTGIMGFSRDEVPWVGPVPGMKGVIVVAGFTGHGMPNTWLSGKAAALMARASLETDDMARVAEAAGVATGLPKAYLVSEERIRRALGIDDVEVREREEMERVGRVEAVQSA